jgi:uncharacterized protein DUF1844
MSDKNVSTEDRPVSREEELSGLFAHMVMQQSNLAMMLLGKIAHPESGQTMKDLDGARLFIDQLEMLEVKTKGNLNKQEEGLLKQSLMSLRLAFVEAMNAPAAKVEKAPEASKEQAKPEGEAAAPTVQSAEEESRKKFTKKY